jgi:hypothetical protein
VLLDRVVDRPGGLSGRPAGRPVSDPPKTTRIGPGAAGARNRQIVNRASIKNPTENDGRRILEIWPSRTRLDLVPFRDPAGIEFWCPEVSLEFQL